MSFLYLTSEEVAHHAAVGSGFLVWLFPSTDVVSSDTDEEKFGIPGFEHGAVRNICYLPGLRQGTRLQLGRNARGRAGGSAATRERSAAQLPLEVSPPASADRGFSEILTSAP